MGGEQQHLVAAGQPIGVYRETKANRVQLYCLGSKNKEGTDGAFNDLFEAIKGAQTFIFIVDWSFQPYVRLGPRTSGPNLANTVGALLVGRANAGVKVAINTWDHASAVPDDQNNEAGDRIDEIAATLKLASDYKTKNNLLFRKTTRGTISYWSFHQKFVVLDAPDPQGSGKRVVKAFFGGLDLTKGRFNWGESPINYPGATVEPLAPIIRNGPVIKKTQRWYDDWYNAEFTTKNPKEEQPGDPAMPRQPWEDFYANIVGPSAWDVVREFVGRWNSKDGATGHAEEQDRDDIEAVFKSLFDKGKFVQEWEDHGGPFVARVVRSIEKQYWRQNFHHNIIEKDDIKPCETPTKDGKTKVEFIWDLAANFESSIQQAYVNSIANANKFIYIETQYFIGSAADWEMNRGAGANNGIPRAIVNKIVKKIKAEEDFHAYVVIPMFPEGPPLGGAVPAQRQFEFATMAMMINRVYKALAEAKSSKKWTDFLSFYFLANWTPGTMVTDGSRRERVRQNRRYQIYVHSKLMIIDDQFLIVGSANLNERSLAGNRDAEICIYIRPDEGKLDVCQQQIQELRQTAWTQHFGVLPSSWDHPEQSVCVTRCQQQARENWMNMAQGLKPDASHIIALPFTTDGTTVSLEALDTSPALKYADGYIFDAEAKPAKPPGNGSIIDDQWKWYPPKTTWYVPNELAE